MTNELTTRQPDALTRIDLVEDWLRYLRQADEAADNTVAAYRRSLSKFVDWLGPDVDYNQVLPEDVLQFKTDTLEHYSPQTTNLYLVAVRSFYSYLVSKNLAAFNPAREIKGPKRKNKNRKRDALTPSEVVELLAQPDQSTPEGLRDKVIITLMLYTAVRSVEVHRANVGHLRQKGDRLVLFVHGKGDTEAGELVVIPREQERVIREYVSRFRSDAKPDEPLFVSFSRRTWGRRLSLSALRGIVKNYFRTANISGGYKTTHSLRHTAITNAIRNGAAPMAVQAMARHKSFDTTLGYYHEVGRLDNPAEDLIAY
jgi:site-specific recombinase XerD